eukprot:CAMPEP_0173252088 /NCGR_PEP_ID=MMETSP1142-20121109/20522_1 /TAXON_ID=483371 /ORGANISM="non described non described, Strain CCMP2298" /LENGTH=150 /DNA_ID=CAMNT_0014185071 /DNA_START=138 /DNA_END=587 /DNA_ORIENTATION=-
MQRPRVVDIEQQIAHLRWRKQQNERSIRNSLEATKVLKQKDTILGITVDQSAERSIWTNSIIRDELSRPLIVTDAELHQIEFDDAAVKRRLLKYARGQLDNVHKMLAEKERVDCKTAVGESIRMQQIENLRMIKDRLENNVLEINQRTPY